jgi:hypothetical protein
VGYAPQSAGIAAMRIPRMLSACSPQSLSARRAAKLPTEKTVPRPKRVDICFSFVARSKVAYGLLRPYNRLELYRRVRMIAAGRAKCRPAFGYAGHIVTYTFHGE